ncbi:hypothetical protein NPIL_449911 [Nephila pilipes]|uniref:Uncharacterized protein n=1 Tax=Nephila pilipes TaxID=299642 RepID=A0A8X6NU72_NEPPI|nr:hypothetical protein NPIL_449911 [Nephila pilipes]
MSQRATGVEVLDYLHLLDDLIFLPDVHWLLLRILFAPVGEHLAHLGGAHVEVEHTILKGGWAIRSAASTHAVGATRALR